MSRWYRAYEGTVTDAKLGEVALVAGCSRSVAIAAWHCLLESASGCNACGVFDATPRRVAVILGEQPAVIEAVFSELVSLGMIADGKIAAWSKRQYESDSSTERSKKFRERAKTTAQLYRNGDATLQQQHATPPDTDTDTEKKELTQREREGFEEFWTSYPEAGRVSWETTEKAWLALSEKDRGRALEALPSFKTWVSKQKNDYITLHAAKFLSTKRFKDHEAPTGKGGTAKSIPILKGTPEFDAWLVAKGGKLPSFPIRGEGGRLVGEGCYQQTKFPPSNEDVAA